MIFVKLRLVPSHLDVCSLICYESWDFSSLSVLSCGEVWQHEKEFLDHIPRCLFTKTADQEVLDTIPAGSQFLIESYPPVLLQWCMCLSFREENLWDVCKWTATSWIQIKLPQPECGALSCCHFTFTLQLIWNVFFFFFSTETIFLFSLLSRTACAGLLWTYFVGNSELSLIVWVREIWQNSILSWSSCRAQPKQGLESLVESNACIYFPFLFESLEMCVFVMGELCYFPLMCPLLCLKNYFSSSWCQLSFLWW